MLEGVCLSVCLSSRCCVSVRPSTAVSPAATRCAVMSAVCRVGCCGGGVGLRLVAASAAAVSAAASAPRRLFSKRLGSSGFVGGGERKVAAARRKAGDATAAAAATAPLGTAPAGTAAATAAAPGQQRGADSIAALEAENEERLAPFMLPIITAEPPTTDLLTPEQRVAEWHYETAVRRRLRAMFIRDNLRLSGKLRRRWEALNGLTDELRRICLLEDRTPLPPSLPIPLQANGQLLLPTTPGLAGAEPWTEKELRKHLDWQQKQKEKRLAY